MSKSGGIRVLVCPCVGLFPLLGQTLTYGLHENYIGIKLRIRKNEELKLNNNCVLMTINKLYLGYCMY